MDTLYSRFADKYTVEKIKSEMRRVKSNLEKIKTHDERFYGYWSIREITIKEALSRYKNTLLTKEQNVKGELIVEPLSSLFVSGKEPATFEYEVGDGPDSIGSEIFVRAKARIRPEFKVLTDSWIKHGSMFGSTGGIYDPTPNKSYKKIKDLLENYIEFLGPVHVLDAYEPWDNFFLLATAMRSEHSLRMLDVMYSDPNCFAKDNEGAGTGVMMGFSKSPLIRSDLQKYDPEHLQFLIDWQVGSYIAFWARQRVKPSPGKVWLFECLDTRISFAIGSRSDGDIEKARLEGDYLYTEGKFLCRQIFATACGVLANASAERKYLGYGVSDKIIHRFRELYGLSCFQEFTPSNLAELWTAETIDTAINPEDVIVVCEDIGMVLPTKAGADNLYSLGFLSCHKGYSIRTMSDLASGAGYTSMQYTPIQLTLAKRILPYLKYPSKFKVFSIGDDFNVLCAKADYEAVLDGLNPYIKIKQSKGQHSKCLGMYTYRDKGIFYVQLTPRIQKTETSAKALSTSWVEQLKSVQTDIRNTKKGSFELEVPNIIEDTIQPDIEKLAKFTFFEGPKEEVRLKIAKTWNDPEVVQKLRTHIDLFSHLDLVYTD